jgi:transposase-like protein
MRKERKHYTAEEKGAILRRHLLDRVPVSDLCEELGLQPTVWRLSTKLCLRESCGSLEAGLEHGIELGKYGTDGPARSFPTALLQGGDS